MKQTYWQFFTVCSVEVSRMVTFLLNSAHLYIAFTLGDLGQHISQFYSLMGFDLFQSGLVWIMVFVIRSVLVFLLGFIGTFYNMHSLMRVYAFESLGWSLVLLLITKTVPIKSYMASRYEYALDISLSNYHNKTWSDGDLKLLHRDVDIDRKALLVENAHGFWDYVQRKYECCGTKTRWAKSDTNDSNVYPNSCCPESDADENCTPDLAFKNNCVEVLDNFTNSIQLQLFFYMVLNFVLTILALVCSINYHSLRYSEETTNSLEIPGNIISHRKVSDARSAKPTARTADMLLQFPPSMLGGSPGVENEKSQASSSWSSAKPNDMPEASTRTTATLIDVQPIQSTSGASLKAPNDSMYTPDTGSTPVTMIPAPAPPTSTSMQTGGHSVPPLAGALQIPASAAFAPQIPAPTSSQPSSTPAGTSLSPASTVAPPSPSSTGAPPIQAPTGASQSPASTGASPSPASTGAPLALGSTVASPSPPTHPAGQIPPTAMLTPSEVHSSTPANKIVESPTGGPPLAVLPLTTEPKKLDMAIKKELAAEKLIQPDPSFKSTKTAKSNKSLKSHKSIKSTKSGHKAPTSTTVKLTLPSNSVPAAKSTEPKS